MIIKSTQDHKQLFAKNIIQSQLLAKSAGRYVINGNEVIFHSTVSGRNIQVKDSIQQCKSATIINNNTNFFILSPFRKVITAPF